MMGHDNCRCGDWTVTGTHPRARARYLLGAGWLALLLPVSPAGAQVTAAPAASEDIIVTASRIQERGIGPTPVLALNADALKASGATDVSGFLNQQPAFLAGNTPAANDSSGGAGSSFLNLRGLGAKRTLVLVNGRRHVPTTVGGSLDVSVLPSIALDRVEVVTGGASAAWGSDAVAGVVNVIYDRNLSGIRADAQYGLSQRGDAKDTKIGIAAGGDFADARGHFLIAGEYQRNGGIADQKDRDWGARRWGVIRNPADTGPTDGIPARLIRENVNLAIATEGGLILGPGPLAGMEFKPDGTLVPFQRGSIVSQPYMIGGSGANFGQYAALLQPYKRANAFFAADYDIGGGVTAFFEGGFGATDAHSDIVQSFALGNLTIKADNAFLSPQLASQLASANIPFFIMGRLNTDMGFIRTDRTQRVHRAVLGLKGRFADSWSWETYFQYGKASSTERLTNNFIPANFALATDAVRGPSGAIVCRATLNPATAAAATGCVPLNPFGFGAPSAAAIDYVSGTGFYHQSQSQAVVAGTVRGELGALWAGPISIATGFEYRKEKFAGEGDQASSTGTFLLGNGQNLSGSIEVKELFGEALVPLLSDLSFAKRLELNAAARLTDYDTIGSVTTWKVGLLWDTSHSVTLRAAISRDIRAPNIGELFAPQGTSFLTLTDPCDARSQAANPAFAASCRAAGLPSDFQANNGLIKNLTGGNPNLHEERATTKTAGIVFAPLQGLRGSIDWYDIDVHDAIQVGTPGNAILQACYGSTGPNDICRQITRDSNGQLVSIASIASNVSRYVVEGVDAQISYTHPVAPILGTGDAQLQISALGTYLIEQSDTSSLKKIDRAGELRRDNSGMPKWRWTANLGYRSDAFNVSTQFRFIGGGRYDNTYGPEDIDDNHISPILYTDIQASVPVKLRGADFELFAGINNLTDEDPRIVPYEFAISALATNPSIYDTIGRFFYGGIRIRM